MKKRLSFTIATVVAAMAATISTASASQTEAATDTNLQPAWEEQLQNGMQIGQETDRRLKLVGYEYLGRIGSVQEAQELVDEIFADESYTVYTDIYADGHRDYDFQTWGSLRKDYEYCGMAVRDQIRHVIATQPTDVIRLTWSHNGNTYTTKALASPDEGIIYDNVATYAVQDVYIVDEEAPTAESADSKRRYARSTSSTCRCGRSISPQARHSTPRVSCATAAAIATCITARAGSVRPRPFLTPTNVKSTSRSTTRSCGNTAARIIAAHSMPPRATVILWAAATRQAR